MSLGEFEKGYEEYYQGEVTGEVLFSGMLKKFDDPVHKYKMATLLQLETETKARLRPVALELGLDLAESDEARQTGLDVLKMCEGMDWNTFLPFFAEAVAPYVVRYREIAKLAPPEFKGIAEYMVLHEESIENWAKREVAGDTDTSLDDVIKQLRYPLTPK